MGPRPSKLLTYDEAAPIIGVRTGTLQVWVSRGDRGIPYLKISRLVRFRREDLEAWLRRQERGGRPEFAAVR